MKKLVLLASHYFSDNYKTSGQIFMADSKKSCLHEFNKSLSFVELPASKENSYTRSRLAKGKRM